MVTAPPFYLYDDLDRLTKTTVDLNGNDEAGDRDTDIVSEQKYNKVGSVIEVIDPRGIVTKHKYDGIQRLEETTVAFDTDEEATTTFQYLPLLKNPGSSVFNSTGWKPTRSTSPAPEGFGAANVTTEVEYDELYRPVLSRAEYQPGLFAETHTIYDKVGNATTVTDPLGKTITTEYDALNRPIKVTNPDGTSAQTIYNSLGQVWKVIDELDRVTETTYDTAGRVKEVYAPEVLNEAGQLVKPLTKTKYDANGNVFEITNPLGQVTKTYYDNRNRPAHVVAPEAYDAQSGQNVAAIVSTEYDEVGNPVKVIDAFGYEAETFYDAANRAYETRGPPVTVHGLAQPVRPTTLSEYDANGNVLAITDPKGNRTENTYDSLNRLRSTKNWPNKADLAEFIQVQFEYDDAGNRTKVIDGNGFPTVFHYDGLKRNTLLRHPDGAEKTLEYNALNLTARVDEDGRRTEYTYDDRHRLDTVTYIDAGGAGQDHTRTYHYDNAGKILTVDESHDNRADVAYTYDALGRTKTETSNGVTHTYTYDIGGNLRNVLHGNTGREIVSTYDALNRLDTMTENGRATTYYYDARGAIVGKMLPNGQLVVEEIDAGGRKLGSTAYADVSQTDVVYDYTYGYDIAGNVVHTDENVGGTTRTISMVYDDVYRLTGETIAEGAATTVTTYTYDKNSNRESRTKDTGPGPDEVTTYDVGMDGLNQLKSLTLPNGSGTVTYTYDEAGNRTSRTDANGTDIYTYDYENRLLTLEDALPDTGEAAYQYVYDYRTRRLVRDESAAASGVVTQLVFSGGLSVQEYDNPANPLNLSGASAKVEYIRGSDWGGGVGGVLYTLRNGAPSYNHYNNRGDVVAKTDGTGSLTYQAGYEAFGTRTSEAGATEDRQKANTKDEDPTGLLNEGMRYRDLEAGVWLTRDPAGFVDGPNLYAYVRQNPWSKFDPLGLFVGLAPAAPAVSGGILAALSAAAPIAVPVIVGGIVIYGLTRLNDVMPDPEPLPVGECLKPQAPTPINFGDEYSYRQFYNSGGNETTPGGQAKPGNLPVSVPSPLPQGTSKKPKTSDLPVPDESAKGIARVFLSDTHAAVEIEVDGRKFRTHQIINDPRARGVPTPYTPEDFNGMNSSVEFTPWGEGPGKTVLTKEIDAKDARWAQLHQYVETRSEQPVYKVPSNTCVSNVCDILGTAGIPMEPGLRMRDKEFEKKLRDKGFR